MSLTLNEVTMIGRISGILLEKNPPHLLVDCHGVGYEVDVPMSTFYNLPSVGEQVVLLTHLAVREDAHLLFGFGTTEERDVFKQLIKISGVGARTALSILSGMSVNDLASAVTLQEAVRLTKGRHRQEDGRAPAARVERKAGRGFGHKRSDSGRRRQYRYPQCLAGAGVFRQGSDACIE